MPTRVLLLLLWICAACLLGCGSRNVLELTTWRLSADGGATEMPVTLPAHVDDRVPAQPCRYVLRTEVAMPREWQGQELTLAIPHLRGLPSLRINHRDMVTLDLALTENYRGSGYPRWRVPPQISSADTLSIELAVEHRWTQSAWLDSVPRLSPTEQGDTYYLFVRHFNHVSALCALTTALFVFFAYAIIFLLDRRRSAHGWFTIEALAACAYPAFELGLLQPVLGVYDAPFMLAAVTLATAASLHFTCAQYNLGRPSVLWDVGFVVCLAAMVLTSDPFTLSRYGALIAVGIGLCNVCAQIVLLARVRISQKHAWNALLLFVSWVALALSASVDFAAWLGLGEIYGGLRTACFGIIILVLAQSAELSIAHITSLRRADELNAELAARLKLLEDKHREVEVLNEELKFQVASRSDQLASALARVATPHGRIRPLEEGEIVEARYRVIRQVGEGAMGAVYEVERLFDKRRFALKMLTDVSGGLNVARFAREAQIVSQINHPNVISIVDVDVSSSGFFYMVMEFVNGLSIRQQQHRYTDPRWVVPVLRQIAEGLSAVHGRGIVHRDLKPGNILVSTGDRDGKPLVKIADFGISSLESGGADAPITAVESPGAMQSAAGLREAVVAGLRDSLPPSLREGVPPGMRDSIPPSLRDGVSSSLQDSVPPSLRDGAPPSLRDGAPPSLRDGAPPSLRDGAPPSLRDGAPPSLRDGVPPSLRDAPPQSLREGMPSVLRDAPPPQSLREGIPPSLRPGAAQSPPDGTPPNLYEHIPPPPRSIRDIVPPPSSHSLADKLMNKLHDSFDTWDTGPISGRPGAASLRSGSSKDNSQPGSDGSLTQTGALMGTPIYMAPELAAGVKFAKPSADIFSLGVIGYELLSGKSPFPEPPALMRLAGRSVPPPPPLAPLAPKTHPAVAMLVERCLAPNPADRPTARELAAALREAMKLVA